MNYLIYTFLFSIAYLIGSIPTAYLIVKKFSGKDIRKQGTGNVGAMNTARATGKWYLFVLVAVLDAIKGGVAVLTSYLFTGAEYNLEFAIIITGFGIILGHCYSLYFKIKDGTFTGGKAIASLGGVLIVLDFIRLFMPGLTMLLIPIALTGNLFLGQFVAVLLLPLISYILAPKYFIVCTLMAIPVLIKQWPRVIPMLKGKEPKWYWSDKKKK